MYLREGKFFPSNCISIRRVNIKDEALRRKSENNKSG